MPDAGDTRMQQVQVRERHAVGGELDGGERRGRDQAGIAWFAVSPKINGAGKVEGQVKRQGYLALADNNLTYPAIAMGANGKGAIAFTVLGETNYPSAGYATIDANGSVGPIHLRLPVSDRPTGSPATRRSWGSSPDALGRDYGAAVTDGNSIWLASEYIAQTCTFQQWLSGAIGVAAGRGRRS